MNRRMRNIVERDEIKVELLSKKDAFFVLYFYYNCKKSKVLYEMSWRLLNRSVPSTPPLGVVDRAAAGVFQIITSSCGSGGGGLPWQPQYLQPSTDEAT